MTYFLFRVQGSGFRWRLRRKKGSQPRLAALSSPFQGKGLAWMLPPSFGRRCPEGAEVGGGKRYPRHTAFPSRGRCPEGADRALAVYPTLFDNRWHAPIAFGTSPEGEARRYITNDFLNLIALPMQGRLIWRRLRRDPSAQVAAVLAFVISHTTFLAAQDDETGRCPKSGIQVTSHQSLATNP